MDPKVKRQKLCACGFVKECKALLQQYHNDKNAPYPDGPHNKQLIFTLSNPRRAAPDSNRKAQAVQRQRLYDRAAEVLRVPRPDDRAGISVAVAVAVHHFPREVIEHYYVDPRKPVSTKKGFAKAKFCDYLLPSDLFGGDIHGKRRRSEENLRKRIGSTASGPTRRERVARRNANVRATCT
mmetsp:Transcript_16484/g.34802  ORF Transcript_16484/g.34802 Transcript_16484/m.34802 type:complete len:181 (+) Transcript_16484:566-1108(+)